MEAGLELNAALVGLYGGGDRAVRSIAAVLERVQMIGNKFVLRLGLAPIGEYVAGSVSMLPLSCGGYMLNVRYSDDRSVVGNGLDAYHSMNMCLRTDSGFRQTGDMVEMRVTFPPTFPGCRYRGVEDLRLYRDEEGGPVRWIGASREYSHVDGVRQVMGTYDEDEHELRGGRSVRSPHTIGRPEPAIEKNWIPIGGSRFIYAWHPFETGSVDTDTVTPSLILTTRQDTPRFFEHVRGSTSPVEHRGLLYCIAHLSAWSNELGRTLYHHMVIRLSEGGTRVLSYTNPFHFMDRAIEYTLGMVIEDDMMLAIVSRMDRDPVLTSIRMSTFRFFDV